MVRRKQSKSECGSAKMAWKIAVIGALLTEPELFRCSDSSGSS